MDVPKDYLTIEPMEFVGPPFATLGHPYSYQFIYERKFSFDVCVRAEASGREATQALRLLWARFWNTAAPIFPLPQLFRHSSWKEGQIFFSLFFFF